MQRVQVGGDTELRREVQVSHTHSNPTHAAHIYIPEGEEVKGGIHTGKLWENNLPGPENTGIYDP